MKQRVETMLCLSLALGDSCARCAKTSPSAPAGSRAPLSEGRIEAGVGASHRWPVTDAVFSAPIGAACVGDTVWVGGFVAAEKAVRVVALRDGRELASAIAIRTAAWSPDARLTIEPAAEGVLVSWRTGSGHEGAGTLALVSPRGVSPPIEVGGAACSTHDGLAWTARSGHGTVRVLARRFSDPDALPVLALPLGRAASLVCGSRTVFVLGEGDDDVTVDAFVPGEANARPTAIVIRAADFADDERDHHAFTVGDDLELLRVGGEGELALRDVPAVGASLHPWHKLRHTLSPEDDVVAIDGEPRGVLVVVTRDTGGSCPGGEPSSPRVHALRVDGPMRTESFHELAPPDCVHWPGPFWVATDLDSARSPAVAWVERGAKLASSESKIRGLAYRNVPSGAVAAGLDGSVELDADALVDAGCDRGRCFAAALLRGQGESATQSVGRIAVLRYPP